jgi:hypothetical protein
MPTIEEQVSAGLSAKYAEASGFVAPVVENKEIATESAAPIIENKELLVKNPVIEKIAIEEKLLKSFDEQLSERTSGKYNKWEDVELSLTPKELKFANEKIKHFNELAEKGVDVTSREFLELQGVDFEKIDKAEDILFEKWKRSEDGEGLSEATIRNDINKKYNIEDWIDKDPSDYNSDDIANREKMARDSNKAKSWLNNYKNERLLEKQVDPSVAEAMAEATRTQLNSWDKFVDSDLVNKITKLSSPISYKDKAGKTVESQLDFEVSAEDSKYVADMMKQLPRDSNAFFNQFIDNNGNRNHEALAVMMLKARSFDKARALSYSAGAEQRALAIEKVAKNTDFKPSESVSAGKVFTTIEEAQKDALINMKI